jgi:hypothetical protein
MGASIAIGKRSPNLSVALESRSAVLERSFGVVDSAAFRDSRKLWAEFREANGFKYDAPKLLTYPANQAKLKKSEVFTVGLTLQHANVAGVETCPWRGECASICVLDNGNGRYENTQRARNVKTQFLYEHPNAFMVLLGHELRGLSATYERVLVRLNVNSDLRWYRILPDLVNGRTLPNVYFYDYTKNTAVLSGSGMVAKNYRAVYSVNESSDLVKVRAFVARGGTAAVVTSRKKTATPPKRFMGLRVVDGDSTDNRYDERGVWVDLSAKGKARALINKSEFVRTI